MAVEDDDKERRVLTRKELAKEQRRAAYQRQKTQRATDPRYLAMKEAAKEQRRAAYQKVKQSRKAEAAASKQSTKERRAVERGAELTALQAKHQHSAGRARLAERAEPARSEAIAPREQGTESPSLGSAASRSSQSTGAEQRRPHVADDGVALWTHVTWGKAPKTLN